MNTNNSHIIRSKRFFRLAILAVLLIAPALVFALSHATAASAPSAMFSQPAVSERYVAMKDKQLDPPQLITMTATAHERYVALKEQQLQFMDAVQFSNISRAVAYERKSYADLKDAQFAEADGAGTLGLGKTRYLALKDVQVESAER